MPLAAVHSINLVPPPGDNDADVVAILGPGQQHPALLDNGPPGELSHTMSPLEAFAYTSSLLAKQLDDENRKGRRVSRLPPIDAAGPFVKRPGFARSQSAGPSPLQLVSTHVVPRKDVELSTTRPQTSSSRLSRIPDAFGGSPVKSLDVKSRMLDRANGSPIKSAASTPGQYSRPHEALRHVDDIAIRSPPVWQPMSAKLPERQPFGMQTNQTAAGQPIHREPAAVPAPSFSLPRSATFEEKPSPRLYLDAPNERPRQILAAAALRQRPAESISSERFPQPSVFDQRPSPRYPPPPPPPPERPVYVPVTDRGYSRPFEASIERSPRFPETATFDQKPSPRIPQPVHAERGLISPHTDPSALPINSPSSQPPRNSEDDAARSLDISVTSYSDRHTESPVMSPIVIGTRPPSIGSEYSITSARQRSFNFSRPMSRASQPSLEFPSRQPSADSQYSDSLHTPISVHSMDFHVEDDGPAPSYIYSSYSLPRGRAMQRNSIIFQPLSYHNYSVFETSSSIMNRPPMSSDVSGFKFDLSPSTLDVVPPRGLTRSNTEPAMPSNPFSYIQTERKHSVAGASLSSSQNTIRAHSIAPSSTVDNLSSDDHVDRGITCHENGSIKESTYHLRKAALLNNPTGMLLYALACRHGWGMKPDQAAGVQWLRKAVTSAGYELAEFGDIKDGQPGVLPRGPTHSNLASKAHRTRFALGVYELGVSSLNGWGVEVDKPLALRCFEIAGEWGDADALSEAGFCYAQGIGCKKDLKRAAHFYREAEKKGVTMVGNSWIHKKKYDSPTGSPENSPRKSSHSDRRPTRISEESRAPSVLTTRSKSMTRRLFSRKKSFSSNVAPPAIMGQPI